MADETRYQIKIENGQKSRWYPAYPKDSIKKLKTQIQDKTGIKIKFQNLYFNNYLLDNNKNLLDYNILGSSTLWLEIKPQEKIIIFVKSTFGQSITVETNKNQKIGKLKEKISFKEKIPKNMIILKFKNKVLDDGKILENYNIGDYSKLPLSIYDNKYEINNLYNVDAIKNKISQLIEIPSRELKLYYKDKILSNDNQILHIDYDSIIKVYANPISVNVKDSSGVIKEYKVKSNDTIKDLKLKIEKEEGISHSCIILGFEDKELDEGSLIYDCTIKNNSCIIFSSVYKGMKYFVFY